MIQSLQEMLLLMVFMVFLAWMVFYQKIFVELHGNKSTNTILLNFEERIVNSRKEEAGGGRREDDGIFLITSDKEGRLRQKSCSCYRIS